MHKVIKLTPIADYLHTACIVGYNMLAVYFLINYEHKIND